MLRNFLTKGAGTLAAGAATALGQPHLAVPASMLASNLADKGITLLANHKFSFGKKKYSPREIIKKAMQIRSGIKKPLKMADSILAEAEEGEKSDGSWIWDKWWEEQASHFQSEDADTSPEGIKKAISDLQDDVWSKVLSNHSDYKELFNKYAYNIPDKLYNAIYKAKEERYWTFMDWNNAFVDNDYGELVSKCDSREAFAELVKGLYENGEQLFNEVTDNPLITDHPGKTFMEIVDDKP